MLLIDVNVLVYAHREDAPNHAAYHDWLTGVIDSGKPCGFSRFPGLRWRHPLS